MGTENDSDRLTKNEIIRKALAAEVPEKAGVLAVTHTIEVKDAQGNMRHVEFIGPEPTTPEK